MLLSDLTPREVEILRLVLAGNTNKAIAAGIYVSEKRLNSIWIIDIYTKISARMRLMAGISGETREILS